MGLEKTAANMDEVRSHSSRGSGYRRRGNSRGRGQGHFQSRSRGRGQGRGHTSSQVQRQHDRDICGRCGREHTQSDQCPARRAKCHACGKMGHYSRMCGRHAHVVREVEASVEAMFLGHITCNNDTTPWTEVIEINGEEVEFKLDSGADVSVLSEDTYRNLRNPPRLQPSKTVLKTYGGVADSIGKFHNITMRNGESYEFDVFVLKGEGNNLLSRSVSSAMGLIKRKEVSEVNELKGNKDENGLLKCKLVKITLKEGKHNPQNLFVSRRIPIPLLPKVEIELRRMEKEVVIVKVEEPTEWCSPIVVVPKKTGQVRICVDLKELNKCVKREQFLIPTIDDILPKLSGAEVFSSLDASSGYWQIPLDDESSKLTTFITPAGRFCFKRLPFGITSASEIFQREMTRILEDLEGTAVYQDDIIVYSSRDDHDVRLQCVLDRLDSVGLKLNRAKCKFRQESLAFLGHVISKNGVAPDQAKIKIITTLSPQYHRTAPDCWDGKLLG